MSPKNIQKLKIEYEKTLLDPKNRIPIKLDPDWLKTLPNDAGIYGIFHLKKLVYVGETGSLRGRMRDLRNTQNHTLRRSVGASEFSKLDGYEIATSKNKYAPLIEKEIDNFIINNMHVKLMKVDFGRKEIEESLIVNCNPIYNKRAQRV